MPTWSPDDQRDRLRVDARRAAPVHLGRQGGRRSRSARWPPREGARLDAPVVEQQRAAGLSRHRGRAEPLRDRRRHASPAPRTSSRSARRGRRPPSSSTCRTARSAAAHSADAAASRTVDVHGDPSGDPRRQLHPARARLHLDHAAQGPRHRPAGALARRHARSRSPRSATSTSCPAAGGKPVNLTKDSALDTDPAWSPDGAQLVYSSDKDSPLLQLWIRDMKSGQARQVTSLDTQPQGASWSPDGSRVVFFNVDGMWRVAPDVGARRADRRGHEDSRHAPAAGDADVVARRHPRRAGRASRRLSTRFREGTNQVLTISPPTARAPISGIAPVPMLAIDSRGGGGPPGRLTARRWRRSTGACSRSGRCRSTGAPLGPPRRVTAESAHAPSWQGDSRHILYQSLDS